MFDLLTARSNLLPYAVVWVPNIYMKKKNVDNFNDFSSEASRSLLLRFHLELPWGRGTEDCSNSRSPWTKMAAMPIYGKNL